MGRDRNRLAGARITRRARRAFAHPEGSKTGELDLPASGKLRADRVEKASTAACACFLVSPDSATSSTRSCFFMACLPFFALNRLLRVAAIPGARCPISTSGTREMT